MIIDLTPLAREIHEQNVAAGWWDDYLPDNKERRYRTAMMLVITELAEACEGDRKNLMDDHLPHRKMLHVELADALIRLLDLAGAYGVPLDTMHVLPLATYLSNAERLFTLSAIVCSDSAFQNRGDSSPVRSAIWSILCMCEDLCIPILEIVAEKRAYNAKRLDHKRSERTRQNGKKY